jgi:hypothetical protein
MHNDGSLNVMKLRRNEHILPVHTNVNENRGYKPVNGNYHRIWMAAPFEKTAGKLTRNTV